MRQFWEFSNSEIGIALGCLLWAYFITVVGRGYLLWRKRRKEEKRDDEIT